MSDWPTWVWVIIGVVALVIIIAIIVTGRRRPDALAPQNQDFVTAEGAETAEPRRGEPDPLVVPTAAAPLVGDIDSTEQVTPRIPEVGEEPDDVLAPVNDVTAAVADEIRSVSGQADTDAPAEEQTDAATVASEQARGEASEEVDEQPDDHLVRHTDHGGAGGYDDERDEDHIPRDDLGRRLDPYGNPVDDGPPIPPSAMGRP